MTDKTFDLSRRSLLKLGAAATTLPLFNINHAFSKEVVYDGSVFDAGGAVLRIGEWGGTWGDLAHKYLLNDFAKEFNCTPWFVGKITSLKGPDARKAKAEMEEEHAAHRAKWGERRSLYADIRKKRREFW